MHTYCRYDVIINNAPFSGGSVERERATVVCDLEDVEVCLEVLSCSVLSWQPHCSI